MNMKLNVTGSEVSEDDFKTYQASFSGKEEISFADLFYYFLWGRSNSPGAARLALRDLLFNLGQEYAPYVYFTVKPGDSFSIRANRRNTSYGDELRAAFQSDPEVQKDFVEEVSYIIKNRLEPFYTSNEALCPNYVRQNHIEFILPLVDEAVGRELYQHHPMHQRDAAHWFWDVLQLWHPENDMPAWLRSECQAIIEKRVQADIAKCRDTLSMVTEHNVCLGWAQSIALDSLAKLVTEAYKSHGEINIVMPFLIGLLEELPEQVVYLKELPVAFGIAIYLRDAHLAFRLAVRHFINYYRASGAKATRNTLSCLDYPTPFHTSIFWLRGATRRFRPNGVELAHALDNVTSGIEF